MRLLDRYVARLFLQAFVGALVVFSLSAVALDFFARLSHFSNYAQRAEGTFAAEYSGIEIVLGFYAAYLPYLIKEVLPFVTVAAGLFTLSVMLRDNEVMPALAAGTSARRLLLPVFLCGALIGVGHLLFQELAIPSLNRKHIALKRLFSGDRTDLIEYLPHLRDGAGTVVRAGSYRFSDQSLRDVVIQRPWEGDSFPTWLAPLLLPDGDAWTAPEGALVRPAAPDAPPTQLPAGTRVKFGVSPSEVEALVSKQGTQEIATRELRRLARKFPERRFLEVALHKQVARPFTSLVLLLLGVPVVLAVGRSLFLGGGVAFFLSATYYFMDLFFTSLGDRGDLPPEMASYAPLLLFASLGAASLATVPT
ncbi:MAG: LptF/LptG family permease [Planctomycetota bacterium]